MKKHKKNIDDSSYPTVWHILYNKQ